LFRNRLTRLGLHFAFIATFAMLGGAIRGLNLLLILAALIVSALIVQWRWCRRSTESLSIDRRLPTEAFAGTPFRVRFRLTNHNRWLPVWMLRIEDTIVLSEREKKAPRWLGTSGQTAALAKSRSTGKSDGKSTASASSERLVAQSGIGVVAGRQTVSPIYTCRIADRGSYRFGPTVVSTSFPLSLMKSQMTVNDFEILDVYPRLLQLRRGWQSRLLRRVGGATVGAQRSGTDDGEFFGLREYHPGDNPKWIHWRTTARLGELAVRQFEQQRRYDVCVLLDAWQADEDASQGTDSETAISLAATLLVDLSAVPGNRIVFACAGEESQAAIGGASFEARRRLFHILAGVRPTQRPGLGESLSLAVEAVGLPQDLIVASPRSREAAMQRDEGLRKVLSAWGRRGRIRWLNVCSTELDQMIIHHDVDGSAGLPQRRTAAATGPPT